ncbi:MAG: SEC-C metal-binding domain-containing protein, partial [Ginsengibacter sp.]
EDTYILTNRLYEEAKEHYNQKNKAMNEQTLPVIKNIRREQGSNIENVAVPFTDGKKAMQAVANLNKTIETNGAELSNALERNITLALIDDAWKEHLRAMDDLRHSVQSTAGYEQKDPLVIYKIEAFNAFKQLNDKVNKDIVSFLAHCSIPVEQNQGGRIQEERRRKTDMSKMRQRKEEFAGAGGPEYLPQENDYIDPSENIKQEPIKVGPKIGRNDPCPCGSGKKYKQCHGKEA